MADQPSILIVDDEPLLREILVEDFEYEGFKVYEASGGNEAFSKIKSGEFMVDTVLSDIRMPDGSGIDLLENIEREITDGPSVVLVSGFADITEEEALAKGAKRLFKKPFDNEELMDYVKSLVGMS
jgi:CheY-like chemotaxis protein